MKQFSRHVLFLTALALFGGIQLHAADITLNADADLYTTNPKPSPGLKAGEVLNISDRIVVGGAQYGYVRFTLGSGIPNADAIQKAVLRIYLPYDEKNSQNTIEVMATCLANGENQWNDEGNPAIGAIFQPKVGAMEGAIAKVTGDTPHSNSYFEWDVTDLLKEKGAGLDGKVVSFRISMKGGVFRFEDREGQPASGNPPQLVITPTHS